MKGLNQTGIVLRLLFLIMSAVLFLVQEVKPQDSRLKGDLRVHDPVMTVDGDYYYIFHTGRGISVKRSVDGINWERYGSVFSRDELPAWHREDIPEQNGHLWAPDIHYRDGQFHLYYSVSAWMNFNSSIGYASNTTLDRDSPDYKWVDHGKVISYKNGGEGVNVIDPQVFIDKDDRVWLFYGSYKAGLRLVELNPETGKLFSEDPDIITITTGLGEGVFIVEGNRYYYIFASRGICCKGLESNYQVVVGRSGALEGPYLNREGKSWIDNHYSVFLAGDYDEPGRGHNGFFMENDTVYIVYHAYTRTAEGASLLNIRPVFMDGQGWPTMDTKGVLFNSVSLPRGMKQPEDQE